MPTNTQDDRIFEGTNGDDRLIDPEGGDEFASTLLGKNGNDVIKGRGGDDVLNGGNGNDDLGGGSGDDRLIGGRDNDVLRGSDGADVFQFDARDQRNNDETSVDVIQDLDFASGDMVQTNLFRSLYNDADGDGKGGDIFNSNNAFMAVEKIDSAEDLIALVNLMTAHDNMEVRVVNNDGTQNDYLVLDFALEGPKQPTIVMKGPSAAEAANTLFAADVVDQQAARTNNDIGDAVIEGLTADTPVEVGAPVTGLVTDEQGDVVDFEGGQVQAVIDHFALEVLTGTEGEDILVGSDEAEILDGLAGNDILVGRDGNDILKGGANDDLLVGELGDDTMEGGEGNDALHGHNGNDELFGGAGDDLLTGEDGDDILNGGEGADRLHGHNGNDTLDGGADDDFLTGEGGDDIIIGGEGNDEVYGHSGNDTIDGGEGDDLLFGDDGDDTIDAGTGNDTVYVGGGKDKVIFETGDGALTVKDFNAWEGDVLDLTGTDLTTFEELKAASSQTEEWGGNLQIDLGEGDLITLEWVNLDHISQDAFIL